MLIDGINVALVIPALLNLFLGILVFIQGRKKKINIVYSLNIIAIIGWIVAMIFYRFASQETSLFWGTILYISPTFIASSFLYFTYIFPSQIEKNLWWRSLLIFGGNLLIVIITAWPKLMIKEVNVVAGAEKEIIFTSYYWFYFFYTFLFFTYGFHRLFIKYLKSRGIEKSQIIYIFLGYTIAGNLAFVTNLIMPWIGYFFLNWLGQVFTCIMVAFTSYAILRYRLMDIRIVAREVFIYTGMAGFVYGIFYLATWFYNRAFGGVTTPAAYAAGVVIAPLFVILFFWFSKKVQVFANKYLFYALYNYQETISKLADELNKSINLNKIVDSIVETVKQTMQLDRAGVLLINQKEGTINYQIAKVIGFKEENGISLVQDNFLTRHLEKTQKLLVRDELVLLVRDAKSAEEKSGFEQLYQNMKQIEASLCLSVVSSGKLIGIIVLGSKVSGDAYSKEDLELLNTLSKQAGIAIENARLYEQIQDLSQNLQQKVDEQTKEIKEAYKKVEKAYEVEKNAHEELKKLDLAKTQFTKAATHHLRTPLTSIIGFLELILAGSYGKLENPEIKKRIISVRKSANILQSLIEDILDITLLRTGKAILNLESTQIEEVIEDIVKEEKLQAKAKGIYLKWEKPKTPLPKMMLDRKRIREAIYNVVDNGIKYTEEGGVTINIKYEQVPRKREQISNIKNKDSNIKVIIQDTGVGLSEEEQRMFLQGEYFFERGKEAEKLWGPGRGIGLVIAYEFIRAHQGKLWVESRGRNKGSTFYVELPVK